MAELILCLGLTSCGFNLSEAYFLGEKWKKLFRLIGVISALIFLDLIITSWNEFTLCGISGLALIIWSSLYNRTWEKKKRLIIYILGLIILFSSTVGLGMIGRKYNSNIKTSVNISFVETRRLYISDDTPVVRTKDSYEFSYIKNGKKESDSVPRDSTHLGIVGEVERSCIEEYLLIYTTMDNNVNPPKALDERKEIEYLLFIQQGSLKIEE